jgi:hypothetical protein
MYSLKREKTKIFLEMVIHDILRPFSFYKSDLYQKWPFWEVNYLLLEIGHTVYEEIKNFVLIKKYKYCSHQRQMAPPPKKKLKFKKGNIK